MTVTTGPSIRAACIAFVALSGPVATEAAAISARVKFACARDYLANCRAHKPDSADARRCMSGVGARLSARCVNALVAAGEVSQKEVAQRAAALKH